MGYASHRRTVFDRSYFFVPYSWRIEKRDIEKNKMNAVGVIVRNYQILKRGDFIECEFKYGGIDYKDHQSVSGHIQKGNCYLVEFSKENPNHSRLVIEEERKCN